MGEKDREFNILLEEENAPLLSGERTISKSCWDNKQFSIGYGTPSFEGEFVDEPEARKRAHRHFSTSKEQAKSLLTEETWKKLSPQRKGALSRMVYQLGLEGTRGFKKTLAFIEEGDFSKASNEMLDSKWFKQDTPIRAARESCIMRHG
jgi:GH24 family phage-related lysozyme (muramidase)